MGNIAGHPDVVSGARLMPPHSKFSFHQTWVGAREDKKVLEVGVTVQRHGDSGWHNPAYDANLLVLLRHKLNDRSQNIRRRCSGASRETAENRAHVVGWCHVRLAFLHVDWIAMISSP